LELGIEVDSHEEDDAVKVIIGSESILQRNSVEELLQQ
jgi:hypothetical protein